MVTCSDNTTTTTYTFTPTCHRKIADVQPPTTLTITINPLTTPTFNVVDNCIIWRSNTYYPYNKYKWYPLVAITTIDNTTTTTYTFTPTSAAARMCIPTTLTITINPLTTPTFNVVDNYCYGDQIPEITYNSINGIAGTWSPAIDNTTTTTYTFTPTSTTLPDITYQQH